MRPLDFSLWGACGKAAEPGPMPAQRECIDTDHPKILLRHFQGLLFFWWRADLERNGSRLVLSPLPAAGNPPGLQQVLLLCKFECRPLRPHVGLLDNCFFVTLATLGNTFVIFAFVLKRLQASAPIFESAQALCLRKCGTMGCMCRGLGSTWGTSSRHLHLIKACVHSAFCKEISPWLQDCCISSLPYRSRVLGRPT